MADPQPHAAVTTPHVLKLGGSLLTLPDLHVRLDILVAGVIAGPVTIVVGGGAAADLVRNYDRLFDLGEEEKHWRAVHAMQLNARMVAASRPRSCLVDAPERAREAAAAEVVAIVDPLRWLDADERSGHGVPHRWSFTSDSIAAHIAARLGSRHLTLLKSTLPNEEDDLEAAARRGIVDTDFPAAARSIPSVRIMNLRDDRPIHRWWQPRQSSPA